MCSSDLTTPEPSNPVEPTPEPAPPEPTTEAPETDDETIPPADEEPVEIPMVPEPRPEPPRPPDEPSEPTDLPDTSTPEEPSETTSPQGTPTPEESRSARYEEASETTDPSSAPAVAPPPAYPEDPGELGGPAVPYEHPPRDRGPVARMFQAVAGEMSDGWDSIRLGVITIIFLGFATSFAFYGSSVRQKMKNRRMHRPER